MHDIDKITIYITFKVNRFLNDMNILHILYQQLHIEVKCVSLSIYTFLYLYMIFMPFYINDGTAQMTHFSSTLIFRIDKLTMHYFFTSFYLIMILQNNLLVPTREFFAQSTLGM